METMTPDTASEAPAAFITAAPTSLAQKWQYKIQFPPVSLLSKCDTYGGNGFYDVVLNNPDCEYDKGDCCPCECTTKHDHGCSTSFIYNLRLVDLQWIVDQ